MNFKEFEELINSGADEIALTEDVFLVHGEGEKYYPNGIEINTDGLVIDGNGHAIDADNNSCIFAVSAKNITLKNVTLKNADCPDGGGAINVLDNTGLKVVNVRFCKNASRYGGAIVNDGNVEIIGSVFEDNWAKSGGAIANHFHMKISNCEFTNNNAETAGAIDNDHTLTIKDSLFDKNTSENGGVIINDSKIVLTDCVFKDNSAQRGGSIINQENGDFNIAKSSFINNSSTEGGIINNVGGRLKIKDVTFTDNFPGKGYLLLNNSKNGQLKAKHITYENTDLDKTQPASDENYLKELINHGINEITLESDIKFQNMDSIQINVDNIVIDGNDHIVDGNESYHIFEVSAKNIVLKNITFKNNVGQGAIHADCESTLKVINCKFIGNQFDDFENGGAAIDNDGETEIVSCIFNDNGNGLGGKTTGGAICNNPYGKMNIKDSSFFNNQSHWGGAIFNYGKLFVSNSLFKENEAFSGGAIYNKEVLHVKDSMFIDNDYDYGTIYSENREDTIINNKCIFKPDNGRHIDVFIQ